jgi:uncharacterized protein (UPF0335 family)
MQELNPNKETLESIARLEKEIEMIQQTKNNFFQHAIYLNKQVNILKQTLK